jgi:hypothetical protein
MDNKQPKARSVKNSKNRNQKSQKIAKEFYKLIPSGDIGLNGVIIVAKSIGVI